MAAHTDLKIASEPSATQRMLERSLVTLATSAPIRDCDHFTAERLIAKTLCATLRCRRAWIWRYNESAEAIVCTVAYDQTHEQLTSGPSVPIARCPQYIQELESTRCLETLDESTDERLTEWSGFLEAERPSAMMHIPIRARGRLAGVLWIEALDTGRTWTPEERTYALGVSDLLAQVFALPASQSGDDLLFSGRDRYLDLVNNALDMLFVIDLAGNIVSANPVTSSVLGYSHEELMVTPPRTLLGDEQIGHAWGLIEEMLRKERETCTFELEISCKDGTIAPVEVKLWPVIQSNQVLAVQGIGRDISERRAAEENQTRLERQLFQAQRLESVGRLAGGIAHDFNNILTAIMGSSEIVLASLGENHLQAPHLNEVLRSSRRAASLIQHLLAFSRKQVLQPVALNVNAVMMDMEALLLRLIGEDIHLEFVTPPGLPYMKADPAQVEQVIVNLAVNARDAMPNGGKLRMETSVAEFEGDEESGSNTAEAGSYICLAISDTGCGMDEDTRLHAYEPFFTTKGADGSGTGLGLSTVYGIVKQSGGYITLNSEVGQGTEFRVYLPVAKEKVAAITESIKDTPEPSVGDGTILLVEDDDALRRLTSRMLTRQGYRVYEAPNGLSALELLKELKLDHLDLLLTDVVMPQMGGPELARHAREQYPDLKVVYMSGYARDVVDRGGFGSRKIPLIQKPFSLSTLVEHIARALQP